MKRRVACAIAWTLAACSSSSAPLEPIREPQPPAASMDASSPPPGPRWSAIRPAATVRAFEATGRLLTPANARAEVTLPLPASIVALRVTPGETLRSGQVIAEVVIPEAARAQGQLDGANLLVAALAARLKQLEQLRSEGLARGGDLADARSRLAEAQASAREAEALIETVESAGLRRRAKHYELLAPIAGVVIAVNAPLGSMRGPSDGPVCIISGGAATRVEVRFGFQLPKHADYELWSGDTRIAALHLVTQAPEVAPTDATRLTWFDADAPLDLPQGSTVRVRMRMHDDDWVLPLSAVVRGATPHVRTLRAGDVPVELIATYGGEALVRAALRPDDLVAQDEAAP